ncbi:phosphoglycerate mutase family protein [Microlunatus speluncae]|uniref:phosphoglycerate mutase family protein n=1 Tax=Microlunatus speluncae TaxID=2594267 RepID=UPI00126685AA|nr:phosphoglycerate mutase family protein [Microlunatus speluncae]
MPTLEIRRHSLRKNTGGSQLSQEGVELARRIGATMGPYDVVATSVVPRARETAVAMGFAVDQEVVTLGRDPGLYAEAEAALPERTPNPFLALAAAIDLGGAYHLYAHSIAALWRDLMTPLAADQSALVVGHSGELEAALVACVPDADYAEWGGFFGCCEGARLTFTNRFTEVEFLRLS